MRDNLFCFRISAVIDRHVVVRCWFIFWAPHVINEIHLIIICVLPDKVYRPGAICLDVLQCITDHSHYVVKRNAVLDESLQVNNDVP